MKILNIAGLSLICLMGAGTAALADTVYNDFGSSFPKFNSNSSSAGYNYGPGETEPVAASFTSGGNYSLTQIDLALGNFNYGSLTSVTVSLLSGGLNGARIGSWVISSIATTPAIYTIGSITGVSLAANATYYLSLSAPSNGNAFDWYLNNQGVQGSVFADGQSGTQTLTAFDVLGNSVTAVPEPESLALLGGGLLSLAGFAAMRRRKPDVA